VAVPEENVLSSDKSLATQVDTARRVVTRQTLDMTISTISDDGDSEFGAYGENRV